jgi:membrane protein
VLVVATLFMVLLGGHLAELMGAHFALGAAAVVGWKVLQWPIAVAFLVFAYALVYYFGPDLKEQHWYWITPGSVVGVTL